MTTTNFGWDVPADTDLVKDGALAMRTLGQDIDTSMADLLGGTSGQVLAKNSNTDMDFAWVTPDDANAIQNAIVDAKGDLIAATAADTPARLPVGTNGQVLTVDSGAATGLKWANPAGGGKVLQVVNAVYSTATSTSSTTYADTGLTASITPSATTSKILVIVHQNGVVKDYNNIAGRIRLLRNSTNIADIGSAIGYTGSNAVIGIGSASIAYLDSPATTSAITYKTQFAVSLNSANLTVQLSLDSIPSTSTITLMEIGA